MLPWICQENEKQSFDMVKKGKYDVIFGHLELVGFEMAKGQMMEHGMDPALFKKAKAVYSGHYHHKSKKGNVHYCGTPVEFTWADYNDPKGFHILDTETLKLEFIQNPVRIHEKIHYTDGMKPPSDVEDKIIKLIVQEKQNEKKFETFLKGLSESEVKIVDEHLNYDDSESKEINVEVNADTIQILNEYVDGLDVNVDKKRLKGLLKELYMEAQIENS